MRKSASTTNTDYDSGKRSASRKDIKRAGQVRKQNIKDKKRLDKFNKKRVDGSVATMTDMLESNKSFWEKISSDSIYAMFRDMGDTTANIDKFQRKRFMLAVILTLAGVVGGYLFHPLLYLGGVGVGVMSYVMKGKSAKNFYKNWKFARQLSFSKFTRLVIPYLKSSGGNMALYTVFNRILKRMEDPEDKKSLYQLMGEMGDNPTNIQPFLDYADRSSGTDMSYLFMTTIFDFQQSTFDVSVIDELGKLASEDMMSAIDEIIEFKLNRFGMFPTKIVLSSFILVIGLAAGLMLHSFKEMGFSDLNVDMDIEPAIEVNDEPVGSNEDSNDVGFIIVDYKNI